MKKDSAAKTADLKDPRKDTEKLKPETIIMDMPEVKDIPGQENIKVPQFKEMQDVTISSAGEEGDGILDDLNSDRENDSDDNSNVSSQEKTLLKQSAGHQPTDETADLAQMDLDNTDNDGELLNEKGLREDRNGEDLDVPGADMDDTDENIGEEDEENNVYSQRD